MARAYHQRLLFLFWILSAWLALADGEYGRRIVPEPGDDAALSLATTLVARLETMTGREFRIDTNTAAGPGIYLLRTSTNLPDRYPVLESRQAALEDLAARGPEAAWLFSPGSNHLFIVGNSAGALTLGIHDHLRRLGWRALLPGPNWTLEPILSAATTTVDHILEPAFRQRNFFGTGGFGGSLPLDPDRRTETEWTQWKQANGFGGSVSIGGHAGEAFNTRYADILQTNPAMRAYDVYPDSHVPYSLTMKPDASDASLQALYVQDRVTAWSSNAFAVSVEPADGGGFCVCPSCTQHDPASSQVFGLAKRVADALEDAHPGGRVSLYAYNLHAGIPADPALRAWLADPAANVFVNVIPYAFQRTDMTGDQLAAAWAAAKPNNRGIYDYWAIPDWANDLPTENFSRDECKLRYWMELGYDGLAAESTVSGGAVGVLWYMAGRLMLDPALDGQAVRDEFYTLAFGPAAPPMKRMIERWGSGFMLVEQELGQSFQDLAEARALAAARPRELARVDDYALYVHYLRLFMEYQKATGTARHTAAEAVLRFIWQACRTDMIHAYRMNELIRNRYESTDTALQADWNPSAPAAAGWAWVRANPLPEGVAAALVADGLAQYASPPNHVPFPRPVYSGTWVPRDPDYTLDGQLTATARNLYGSGTFLFYVRPGLASVTFEFTPGGLGNIGDTDRIQVLAPAGSEVYANRFGGNGIYGSNGVPVRFTVPTPVPGTYTLTVHDPKKSFILSAERNLPFVLMGALTSSYQVNQKAYFFVPPGLPVAGLYAPGALPVEVRDADGRVVAPSYGNGIGESDYPVAEGQADRAWSMANLKCYAPGAIAINLPAAWAFSPTGLMIPSNAPPTVQAGPDLVIVAPASNTLLRGTVTDDNLSPAPACSSRWTCVSGPAPVVFADPAAPETTAAFPSTGTYVLRLEAADSGGLAAWDEATATVSATPPNTAPVVDAGTNAAVSLPDATLFLQGSVTDDGRPEPASLAIEWTEVHGPGQAIFADPAAAVTEVTFDAPGSYRLRLTARDGELAAYDEVLVTVSADAFAPTYQIGDTGQFGAPAEFSFSGIGLTFSSTAIWYAARFRALELAVVDRVYQRYIGVDSNTLLRVGIMGDDGNGNPDGRFLAVSPSTVHPPEGCSWTAFTNTVTLEAGRLYFVVTQPTDLGGGSFMIYRSPGNSLIRPWDRATDPSMSAMHSLDGGQSWTVQAADPFFTLGLGGTALGGPGNAIQNSVVNNLRTQGGTGQAMGQAFLITTREAPTGSRVVLDRLALAPYKSGATHDLVIRLRRGNGEILGTATCPAGTLTTTSTTYSLAFDDGRSVYLKPGERYFLTTELAAGSGSGEYVYFKSVCADAATRDNSWGGTQACVPILSEAGNRWDGYSWSAPVLYPGRDHQDLWFAFSGRVVDPSADSVGDGITDEWRNRYFGGDGTVTNSMSAADADPDGDESNNLEEFQCGTNPTNAGSRFQITHVEGSPGTFRFSWLVGGGRTTVVQSAASLAGPFSNASPVMVAPGEGDSSGTYQEEVTAPRKSAFYRVLLVP